MVKLNLGALAERRKTKAVKLKRLAWYKATEQQQTDYRINLEEHLKGVALPDSLDCRDTHCRDEIHSNQRDDLVLDIMGAVIESSHKCIPMVGGRQKSVRPDSGMVPGWREEVAPFRDASIFWHSLWLSAGRPNTGQLYLTMKMTRNKYHHALRRGRLGLTLPPLVFLSSWNQSAPPNMAASTSFCARILSAASLTLLRAWWYLFLVIFIVRYN